MKIFFATLLILILAGCANVQNAREAKLMPEEVAKKILIKYAGEEWVNNPTGHQPISVSCSKELHPLPFPEINKANVPIFKRNRFVVWNTKEGIIGCSALLHEFPDRDSPYTDEQVNDITDALVSLGANLPEAKKTSK